MSLSHSLLYYVSKDHVGVSITTTGAWVIFNEDGAAMPPGASFNVHVLTPSATNFIVQAQSATMQNGAVVINNQTINNDPNAIIFITQNWNPSGTGSGNTTVTGASTGAYNSHPVGVSFNSTNWYAACLSMSQL